MEWPELAEIAPGVFPEDVIARAKELKHEIGSVGAYSHSMGVPFIRKNVAKFIEGMSTPSYTIIIEHRIIEHRQTGAWETSRRVDLKTTVRLSS